MIQYQANCVTVFESVLYQTTTTVIENEKMILLIDPNWLPTEVSEIKQYVDERLSDKKLYLIFTHSDFDHIIAAGAFPNAYIIASEAFENNPNKSEIIETIHAFDHMYYLNRPYDIYYPTVDKVIKEGHTKVNLDGFEIDFYLAPGHTEDGLITYIKELETLIVGDYLSDVEFPFITSSYTDYQRTIKCVEEIIMSNKVSVLIPGHGTVAVDHQMITERINDSKWYLSELGLGNNIDKELALKYQYYASMKKAHKNNRVFFLKEFNKGDSND